MAIAHLVATDDITTRDLFAVDEMASVFQLHIDQCGWSVAHSTDDTARAAVAGFAEKLGL